MKVIIIMSIFSFLFGCSKSEEGRFVSDLSFKQNLSKQIEMTPNTLKQLRSYGVKGETKLKLEFFFYTDVESKALSLSQQLQNLKYEVKAGSSSGDDKLMLVTGWTIPIQMDEHSVVKWVEEMVKLGFDHDCEFDGWGTNPEQ